MDFIDISLTQFFHMLIFLYLLFLLFVFVVVKLKWQSNKWCSIKAENGKMWTHTSTHTYALEEEEEEKITIQMYGCFHTHLYIETNRLSKWMSEWANERANEWTRSHFRRFQLIAVLIQVSLIQICDRWLVPL